MKLCWLPMICCFATGVFSRRYLKENERLFAIQAGLAFAAEGLGVIIGMMGRNNHVIFNFYVLAEFFLILFAARSFLEPHFRLIAIIATVLTVALFAYDLSVTGLFYAAFHAWSGVWLILGTIYLIVLLKGMLPGALHRSRFTNIIAACLAIYYFCTVVRWSLFRYINESEHAMQLKQIAMAGLVMSVLRYTASAVVLLLIVRERRRAAGIHPQPLIAE